MSYKVAFILKNVLLDVAKDTFSFFFLSSTQFPHVFNYHVTSYLIQTGHSDSQCDRKQFSFTGRL